MEAWIIASLCILSSIQKVHLHLQVLRNEKALPSPGFADGYCASGAESYSASGALNYPADTLCYREDGPDSPVCTSFPRHLACHKALRLRGRYTSAPAHAACALQSHLCQRACANKLEQGPVQLHRQLTGVMQSVLAVQQWEMPEEADAGAPALLEEREAGEHVAALQQEVAQLRLLLAVRRSASRPQLCCICMSSARACGACAQKHSRFLSRITLFLPCDLVLTGAGIQFI